MNGLYLKDWLFQHLLWVADENLNCAAANLSDKERSSCLEHAFNAGAGLFPYTLNATITAILLTAAFLWVAWMSFSQYQSFANGDITFYDLLWRVIRGLIVLMLLTLIAR